MGLECSHDAFDGGYAKFMLLRSCTLLAAGGKFTEHATENIGHADYELPDEMRLKKGLNIFLTHSDCDGSIGYKDCKLVSKDLTEILPNMKNIKNSDFKGQFPQMYEHLKMGDLIPQNIKLLKKFIAGCNLCFEEKEDMMFF